MPEFEHGEAEFMVVCPVRGLIKMVANIADARTFCGTLEYADAVSSSRRGRDRSGHERSE